jgi:hypothetical protein
MRVLYRNRADLRLAFPEPLSTKADEAAYLLWYEREGHFYFEDAGILRKLVRLPGYIRRWLRIRGGWKKLPLLLRRIRVSLRRGGPAGLIRDALSYVDRPPEVK